MAEIGVVHLVRAANGIEPFRRFLDSYGRCRGGIDHELLIIFKGFTDESDAGEHGVLLKNFQHREMFISDLGFDLRAYSLAADHFEHDRFCFLNSFSVIQDKSWLLKLNSFAVQPGVGLVGASGSYESLYTNLLMERPPRCRWFKTLKQRMKTRRLFKAFPNPHIRTNGFMISRRLMRDIWPRNIETKEQSHLFESGKQNLSQKVLGKNLKILTVGRDGRGYEKEEWAQSFIFRQSNQENLLIADNQTSIFDQADVSARTRLTQLSWGKFAVPDAC